MKNQPLPILFPSATTSICLKIGLYIEDGLTVLRIDTFVNGKVVLRDVQTNETRVATEHQVISAILEGKVKIQGLSSRQVDERFHVSGRLQNKINLRQESNQAVTAMLTIKAWLDELHGKDIDKVVDKVWIRAAVAEIGRTKLIGIKQPSLSTLAKAQRQLNSSNGDWSQLIPRYSERGGGGKTRIDSRAELIITKKIEEIKSSKSRIIKEEVYQSIRTEIQSINIATPNNPIAIPGDMTIYRRLTRSIPKIELLVRTSSRRYVNDKYRSNAFPRAKTTIPLLISEYDDLDTGNYLVNHETRLPVGRAYITHGIDRGTSVPLGCDISHEYRSYDSAMGAIADSFLPKDLSLPQYANCNFPWDGYGVQGTIFLDNAKYNKSKSMEMQALAAEAFLTYTRPRGPTEKRSIEYFNSITESDFCIKLPGWRGKKDDPNGVKVGMQSAFMDVNGFKRAHAKWITDVYMNKPGIDGWTPRQRWQDYYKNFKPSVRWSREEVAIFRLRPDTLKFRSSGGVKRLQLPYDNEQLQNLRKLIGYKEDVVIYIDRNDLTYILVKNPLTKQLFRVGCCFDYRYTKGLNEAQQMWILKDCYSRKITNPSINDMVHSRTSLQKLVEDEQKNGKMKRRKFAQNMGTVINVSDKLNSEEANEIQKIKIVEGVISNLEWQMMQLQEVPIELSDEEWGAA